MGQRSITNIVFCLLLAAALVGLLSFTGYWLAPVTAGPG
jgi:hypothetical protein